ncbi:carbohydrate ABC transporter permease [Massiliimalia massiliensis]|uniref:carbohydrate ABC transporter permease n=1 Tax=Massiliimalia massiliensis TaxID=1852384 RepID=UPI0009875242|nr:sugar ABC transporter permease [Massiliimalia massiliensis]
MLSKTATKLGSREKRSGILMTLPAILVMIATVLYPIGWSLLLSFSDSASVFSGKFDFIGFDNYIKAIQSSDFQNALVNTLKFVACTIVLEIIVGFIVSLTLNSQPPGHKVFKLLYTLPLMIAPLVSGLQWRWMLTDQYGVVNNILSIFGVKGPTWFANPTSAFAAIILANVWLAVPFCILVLVSALLSLPETLYEAGRLDGANLIQEFWYITLPQLKYTILTILVIRLADAFRVFDIVYVLTSGGPGNSTEVASTYIYTTSFTRLHFGVGAAASFMSLIIVGIACFTLFKLMGDSEEDVM